MSAAIRALPRSGYGTALPEGGALPSTELRHVSVLFCDLVGFTPFSEKRDPEEVREVLSGYFDLARAIVGRYGGIVEKFIGDAVMAVWGAPVAKEDDAERAVRAGLELVSAVAAYGAEHRTRPSGPGRDRDRWRSHDRDCRGGPRHRRPGEHRRPHPVRRPAGVLLRRRDDEDATAAAIAYATQASMSSKVRPSPCTSTRRPVSSRRLPARSARESSRPPSSGATASFAS